MVLYADMRVSAHAAGMCACIGFASTYVSMFTKYAHDYIFMFCGSGFSYVRISHVWNASAYWVTQCERMIRVAGSRHQGCALVVRVACVMKPVSAPAKRVLSPMGT